MLPIAIVKIPKEQLRKIPQLLEILETKVNIIDCRFDKDNQYIKCEYSEFPSIPLGQMYPIYTIEYRKSVIKFTRAPNQQFLGTETRKYNDK